MGAWGIGLYSNDMAADLRDTVKAVSRLPFAANALLDLICSAEPSAAEDPKDEEHTVFWLAVADQFAKRGIDCTRARDRALAIIADGSDLATMAALGMDEKSLRKRRAMLDELRSRILAPIEHKPRPVLKAPQKLVAAPGEALTYPVCKGDPINPYAVGKDYPWVKAWKRDGFGAFVVADCGLMFGFLAWYRPLVITEPLTAEPMLATLFEPRMWLMRNPGTLSARHYANMQLKPLGRVAIDAAKLAAVFPDPGPVVSAVVSDISLANNINIRALDAHETHRVKHGYPPTPRIDALGEVVKAI
jgi:hypothetical protein